MSGVTGNVKFIYTNENAETQALTNKTSVIFGDDGSFWAQGKQYIPADAKFTDTVFGNAKIFYGTCSTSGGTTAKVVTCPEFTSSDLVKGALIFVTFSATNAVSNTTMNVNGTGAKPIKKIYNQATPANLNNVGEIRANQTYLFAYDGTNWVCITLDVNSNTTYDAMTIAELRGGTATTSRSIQSTVLKQAYNINDKIITIAGATIEVPTTELSSNYSTSTYSNEYLLLGAGDTYEDAFGKLEKAIIDNEEVVAEALNDLDSRFDDLALVAKTGSYNDLDNKPNFELSNNYEISSASNDDLQLESGDTFEDAFGKIEKTIENDELIVGTALNDLDNRLNDLALVAKTGSYNDLNNKPNFKLSDNYEMSTELNDDLQLESGDTFEDAFGKLEKNIIDNEKVISTALNILNAKFYLPYDYQPSNDENEELRLKSHDSLQDAIAKLEKTIIDNEKIISASLNDLNKRIYKIENYLHIP